MEKSRLLVVIVVVEAVIILVLAGGLVASLMRQVANPPPSESVVLRITGVAENDTDDWDRDPAAGHTFVFIAVNVTSGLSSAVTLDNTSFTLDTATHTYPGGLPPPGELALPAGGSVRVVLVFEVALLEQTRWIHLSEGAAQADAPFTYTVGTGGSSVPHLIGMIVSVTADGRNWSLQVGQAPPDLLPSSTYLLIRNTQGDIVLPRTPFSSLTWSVHSAVFQDATPSIPEIRPGDGLLLSRLMYGSGTMVTISDDIGVLWSRNL